MFIYLALSVHFEDKFLCWPVREFLHSSLHYPYERKQRDESIQHFTAP